MDINAVNMAVQTVRRDIKNPTSGIGVELSDTIASNVGRVNLVTTFGADPTGATFVDAALQAAFDYLRVNDNTTLYVPAGEYMLSRKADDDPTHGYSAAIFRGTVEGDGDSSHFFLDPTATNPTRYYPIRIGTKLEQTDGAVTFRNLKFTGNKAVIGGASVMGFCAGHDGGAGSELLASNDVTVENCTIVDTAVAVGCTKNPLIVPNGTTIPFFKNWRVRNNKIVTTSNKAIELGHCDGGWAEGNDITNVFNGPQAIFYSRNIWIKENIIRYLDSGINITQGVTRFWVLDNDVQVALEAIAGAAAQALFFRTEPNAGTSPIISDGVIRGNRLSNTQTTPMRAIQFQTRTEVTAATYERLLFEGNNIDGVLFLRDATSPAKTTIRDVKFTRNRFSRAMDTIAQATCMVDRIKFDGNEFAAAQTINGSDWQFREDEFSAGLTLAASSANIRGAVDAPSGTITDSGTGNTVTARAIL